MPKTEKREASPAEKSLADLRQKAELAREADSKKSDDKTKAAVAAAEKAVKDQTAIVNRERFQRVGGARATRTRDAIRNLSGVAQPRSYNYTSADVDKLEKMLADESASTIKKLRAALDKTPTAAKTAETFSF